MEIELIKDLIKSRQDNLLEDLRLRVGGATIDVYPDFSMEVLESPDFNQQLLLGFEAEVLILRENATELKIESLKALLKNKYRVTAEYKMIDGKYLLTMRSEDRNL